MNSPSMPQLRIGPLTIEKPIIQGGMGVGISMSGLASAVADAGGVGVLSSVGLGMLQAGNGGYSREDNLTALVAEIRKARKKTEGVLGLNIMVAATDFTDLLRVGFKEKIDLVFLGAGLPLKLTSALPIEEIKQAHTRIGVIVSSARAAQLIFQYWEKSYRHVPDVVVVEGPLAGGHLGFKPEQIDDPAFALENLVQQVIPVVESFARRHDKEIPVIAAGGIYTGHDIHRFLKLGAAGVQMATRFVATEECDASDAFKHSYLECREEDIAIIQSPVGLPGRAIQNLFLQKVSRGEKRPVRCPWKCLKTCQIETTPYCIANALINAQKGKLNGGFAFAGANAYRVDKIISVKELFQILEREYRQAAAAVKTPADVSSSSDIAI